MFKNRNDHKPNELFLKHFKENYPHLGHGAIATSAGEEGSTSLSDALDVAVNAQYGLPPPPRSIESRDNKNLLPSPVIHSAQTMADELFSPLDSQVHDLKDADQTPRDSHEPWNFGTSGLTPSMMDPDSHAFTMFSHQMPGYYTPTPGGTSTLYHNQAGDLHTPGLNVGLSTPLSLPTSEGALHAGHQAAAFHGFHNHLPQHIPPQAFDNVNPFHMHQPTSFPPHQFTHQPPFDHLEGPIGESPVDDLGMDVHMHTQNHSPQMLFHSHTLQNAMKPPHVHPSAEKFRYHVTLNAPTAMIKNPDEIPITYLNKGQAYTLNVVDTLGKQHPGPVKKYRTFVRVSFEDEQQRQKPAACWQLWKEGRGTNEAHHRGGKLQAVEYVESGQTGAAEDPSKPRIELESASFDGFCVLWSPPMGSLECPISVRFNFLSTDFSHSKGVKGIPVRLCAKTEIVGDMSNPQSTGPEVCYCKTKLFRDHGAERKLSNDIAHVKKTIDKLNGQIAQIESGVKDLGKRKRSGSMAKLTGLEHRAGKIARHRRTWSMNSVTSTSGRGTAEDDLYTKLATLQDMFTSTRPASVLYLRGDEEDDPDLHPVKLSGESQELFRTDSTDTTLWEERQSSQPEAASSMASNSPSANSVSGHRGDSKTQQPTPFSHDSRVNSSDWRNQPQTATMDIEPTPPANPQHLASPPDNQSIKIQTRSAKTGTMSGWIETLDVDPNYQPPPERPVKPVACFYIQPRVAGRPPADNFYRAIYLYRRTLKDFVNAVATKCNIEPTQVLQTIHVTRDGKQVLFGDDDIVELSERQDMTAEFSVYQPETPMRPTREWDAGPTDVQCDGDVPTVENVSSIGYQLQLLY